MHEMQTIVTNDVCMYVCQSECLSRGFTAWGHSVQSLQSLPNHVGLLFYLHVDYFIDLVH